MKAVAALSAGLVAVAPILASLGAGAAEGVVVLKKAVTVPEDPESAFPRLGERQVVACLQTIEDGYLVVCPDSAGTTRIAFLPNRDEWGHPTAKSWVFDSTLPSNTLRILSPADLRPGWIPLERGARYPIVRSDDSTWTLLFSFAELQREIRVARADAELLPPPKPETDPAKIRAQQLAQAVEQSKAQMEELRKRLESTRANAERLAALNGELAQMEVEKARIKGEIVKAEALCKELMAALPPARQPALTALAREVERMSQQQADFDAKLQKVRLEAEPLKPLQQQIVSAEAEIEKVKAALRARNAELDALQKTHPPEDIQQDKEAVKTSLDSLARQNATLTGQIQQLDLGKNALKNLMDRLDAVQQENQQLQTQIQTLTTEIQELQKKIRDLRNVAPANAAEHPKAI